MKCELVAAYAAGGLDPAEAAKVEELLARDDDARAELIEIRKALAAVKAARPLPASEPDWDAMAREIRQACAGDDPAGPGWLARVAARLGMGEVGRPARWWARPVGLTAIASGVAGAAAIAIAQATTTRPRRGSPTSAPRS